MRRLPRRTAGLAPVVVLAALFAAACTPGGSGATSAPGGASTPPAAASTAPGSAAPSPSSAGKPGY